CGMKIVFLHFIDDSFVDDAPDEVVHLLSILGSFSPDNFVNERVGVGDSEPCCPMNHQGSEFSRLSLCAPLACELFGGDVYDGGCEGCLATEEYSVCRSYERQVESCESMSPWREDVVSLAVFEKDCGFILVND